MNFIKRIKTWMAYKRCLRKYDEAIECMKKCLDGTATYRIWSNTVLYYLDRALEYKAKLDT